MCGCLGSRAHLKPVEVASQPSRRPRWLSHIMSCSIAMSPAATAIEAAMSVPMLGATLGDEFGSVRHVQRAAVGICYTGSGIDAHL